jgi:hypothetical protein
MLRPARPLRQGGARAGSRAWAIHAGVFPAALALTLVAWGPALDGWFLLDDYRWVMPSGRSFDVLRSFVSTWGHGVAYRPIMRVSFLADLEAFGWNAWAWHLHNLVLHAVNVTLLWSLIRAATSSWTLAAAIAALFAVSPLGHENIAWISGRTHLLGVTFLLISANLLLRSAFAGESDGADTTDAADKTGESRLLTWGGVAAFVAAMATYEPMMVLPFVALITVMCFHSIAAIPSTRALRLIVALFAVLIAFAALRFVMLRGQLGTVGPRSPWMFYEPIRWWIGIFVMRGDMTRTIVPLVVISAFAASWLLMRMRPSLAPPSAQRVHVWLALVALAIFLPFSTAIGIPDRFLYLVQVTGIAAVVLPLWLIARMSRFGQIAATAIVVTLIAAGVAGSRQAARDWTSAGTVVRAVATELKRLYPVLPEGADVVLDGVPRRIGRADVHVLYTQEAVLQAYDDEKRRDTRVFFAEDLRSPESYHARSAAPALDPHRPARRFHFDLDTLTLAELPALSGEQAHDAPSIR